jgi:hypothetical protein
MSQQPNDPRRLQIHLRLESDATFGRGDGVAGLVDAEVEHDPQGFPFIRGRVLKGLLVEEWTNLLFALSRQKSHAVGPLRTSAARLFGRPGSTLDDDALMHVGPAQLPDELREAVAAEQGGGSPRLTPDDVLESLTAIRRQTAVEESTGAPAVGTLRSMRVVLRGTLFVSRICFDCDPNPDDMALLTACVMSLRRGGTGRNRGRGRLTADLHDEHRMKQSFDRFSALLRG